MSETAKYYFNKIVENVMRNWAALQLAVQFGGAEGAPAVCEWLIQEVEQYIYTLDKEGKLEEDVILDFLEDTLSRELKTEVEDGSTEEITAKLIKCYRLCKQEDSKALEELLSSLPKFDITNSKEKRKTNTTQDTQEAHSSSSDLVEAMDCSNSGNQLVENVSESGQSSEDGWQVVTKGRTKHTK